VEIAHATLAQVKDGQKVVLAKPATGRYIRLTVLNGYGDTSFMELMDIEAFGTYLKPPPDRDVTGTYDTDQGKLHLQQTGNSVVGCYEQSNGLVETGVVEGRVLRFTWSSDEGAHQRWSGPAIMRFPDDGKGFIGRYWHGGAESNSVGSGWEGTFVTKDVGACPNWKPGNGNAVEAQLQRSGRARLYGILFDTDSDHLKAESKTTLDALVAAAHSQPTWRFSIEGHTDNVGTGPHNQTLSEKRAAAVKAYMVHAGIDGARLSTVGLGATRPVATNDTSIGRAQNRRVEVATGQ
jgi:outer membrane protein OmpA-like peptidoglycan-associated protein